MSIVKNKVANVDFKVGNVLLNVDYIIDKGQKGETRISEMIPPSVEIREVWYDKVSVLPLLNEIGCDLFFNKIEKQILDDNGYND